MNAVEYMKYDAVGLRDLVAQGDVTAGELLDAALARMADVNPTLNAVVVTLEDEARSSISAGLPQGPFTGVPFLIKDITTQMRGVVTSAGSRLLSKSVAEN